MSASSGATSSFDDSNAGTLTGEKHPAASSAGSTSLEGRTVAGTPSSGTDLSILSFCELLQVSGKGMDGSSSFVSNEERSTSNKPVAEDLLSPDGDSCSIASTESSITYG